MPRALRTLRLSFCATHLMPFAGWSGCSVFATDWDFAAGGSRPCGCRNPTPTTIPPTSSGSALRCPGGPAAHPQDRNSAVQRYLSVLAGPPAVPRPVHLATIPQAEVRARSVNSSPGTTPWRAPLLARPRRRTTLTFYLDSGVLTVSGKPPCAGVGYNPQKHSRRSYHPLIGKSSGLALYGPARS
jgi:hypothetical protein